MYFIKKKFLSPHTHIHTYTHTQKQEEYKKDWSVTLKYWSVKSEDLDFPDTASVRVGATYQGIQIGDDSTRSFQISHSRSQQATKYDVPSLGKAPKFAFNVGLPSVILKPPARITDALNANVRNVCSQKFHKIIIIFYLFLFIFIYFLFIFIYFFFLMLFIFAFS